MVLDVRVKHGDDRLNADLNIAKRVLHATEAGLDRSEEGLDRSEEGLDRYEAGLDRSEEGFDVPNVEALLAQSSAERLQPTVLGTLLLLDLAEVVVHGCWSG